MKRRIWPSRVTVNPATDPSQGAQADDLVRKALSLSTDLINVGRESLEGTHTSWKTLLF
ncbi:hypothetical protein PJI16_03565 [Nitrospira sp. MA-1]|nr:hypothetical protein [Nitrospira sp. MA-1]